MQGTLAFLQAHYAEIVTILWLISEILGSVPSIKSNSIFQVLVALLQSAQGKSADKPVEG